MIPCRFFAKLLFFAVILLSNPAVAYNLSANFVFNTDSGALYTLSNVSTGVPQQIPDAAVIISAQFNTAGEAPLGDVEIREVAGNNLVCTIAAGSTAGCSGAPTATTIGDTSTGYENTQVEYALYENGIQIQTFTLIATAYANTPVVERYYYQYAGTVSALLLVELYSQGQSELLNVLPTVTLETTAPAVQTQDALSITPLGEDRFRAVFDMSAFAGLQTYQQQLNLSNGFSPNTAVTSLPDYPPVDTAPPTVNLVNAVTNASMYGGEVLRISDIEAFLQDDSGISYANAYLVNSLGGELPRMGQYDPALSKVTFTQEAASLPDGNYVVYVEAVDQNGNYTRPGLFFRANSRSPAISFETQDGQLAQGNSAYNLQDIRVVAVDGNEIDQTATIVTLNGAGLPQAVTLETQIVTLDRTVNPPRSIYSLALPAGMTLEVGSYTLSAQFTDLVGSTASASFAFNVDLAAPEVVLYNRGVAVDTTSTTTVIDVSDLTFTVTDDSDPSPRVVTRDLVYLDGSGTRYFQFTWNDVDNVYQFSDIGVGGYAIDGPATLTLNVVDTFGNASTVSYSLEMAVSAPVVELTRGQAPLQDNEILADISQVSVALTDYDPVVPPVVRVTGAGVDVNIPVTLSQSSSNTSVYTLNMALLEENVGATQPYMIEVTGTDQAGNSRTVSRGVYIDSTNPVINLTSNGEPFVNGGQIGETSEFVVQLQDNSGLPSTLLSAAVAGGPAGIPATPLTWNTTGDIFTFQNVPLGTVSDGEPYSLSIDFQDAAGNFGSTSYSFMLVSRTVGLQDTMATTIDVPAVAQTFSRASGRNTLYTEPLTNIDGTVAANVETLYASVSAASTVPLLVNGVTVAPGQTVEIASAYDFSAAGGVIDLPMSPASDGVVGSSELTLYSGNPELPQVQITVNSWLANVMTSGTATVARYLGQIELDMNVAQGVPCRLSSDETVAQESDIYADPVCHVQFVSLPETIMQVENPQVGIRGTLETAGINALGYIIYVYNESQPVVVGRGSVDIDVQPLTLSYATDIESKTVYQAIQRLAVGLEQTEGPDCRLTLDAQVAMQASRITPYCFLEWLSIPAGMSQPENTYYPELQGAVSSAGGTNIAWRVSLYTMSEEKVVVSEGMESLDVIAPPVPQIAIQQQARVEVINGRYYADVNGAKVASATIEAPAAGLTITHYMDGVLTDTEVISPRAGVASSVVSEINVPARALWQESQHSIRVEYTDMPTVFAAETVSVVAVPPVNVRVNMSPIASSYEVVNTSMPVMAISINGYDPAVMGEWEVNISNMPVRDQLYPVSDTALMEGGAAELSIDLVDESVARLVASASLRSPYPDYARVIQSRVVSFSLIEGGALTGEILSNRLSGQAPFNAYLAVRLDDRSNMSIADISWQMSADNGATWQEAQSRVNRKGVLYDSYDIGSYLVKAVITNAVTGAEYETLPVQLVAYDVPRFSLQGSITTIVGSPGYIYPVFDDPEIIEQAEANAQTTLDYIRSSISFCITRQFNCDDTSGISRFVRYSTNVSQAKSRYLIEYSIDQGETWLPMYGAAYRVNADEVGNSLLYVRARSYNAPEDDPYAYYAQRVLVNVKDNNKPITTAIMGPRRVEVGMPSSFTSVRRDPYYNMLYIDGDYWTLPDGSVVYGKDLEYVPTQADMENGVATLQHTAINNYLRGVIDGVAERQVNVWEYVWPEFTLAGSQQYTYAPSTASASIVQVPRSVYPEGFDIQWSLPQGVESRLMSGGRRLFLTASEPGSYPVTATLTDARGNTTVLSETFVFGDPPPFTGSIIEYGEVPVRYAPHAATFRARFEGGHMQDRITNVEYVIDGELQPADQRPGRVSLGPGTHTVTINGYSRMGRTPSVSKTFEVFPNPSPTCDVSSWPGRGDNVVLVANCSDANGRVLSQEWYIDGELVGSGNKIVVNGADIGVKEIYTRAMDNEQLYSQNYYF